MDDGTTGEGFLYGQALHRALKNKGYTQQPDFDKVFDCCRKNMTPEETANEIIKNNWWGNNGPTAATLN